MNSAAAKIRERLQGKKTASPHRIARNSETVWGDARESGDGAQGAARGGIYRCDGRYGEKDGQRAGRIQIDGAQGYGVAACAPVRAAAQGSGGRDGQKQGGTPPARRRGDEETICEDRSIEA